MGILKCHIDILLDFKKKNPKAFTGETLTLGQQAVYINKFNYLKLIKKYNLSKIKLPKNFDESCKIPSWKGTVYERNINANSFFYLLGSKKTFSLDFSNYENSDYIYDLNKKLPNILRNKFNTVIDIGTSEHVFNFNQVLKNITYALKKNGFYILSLPSSNAIDHGFYSFSPSFFYDYFSINNYDIQESYIIERSPFFYESKYKIYKYKPGPEMPIVSSKFIESFFILKKNKNSFTQNIPFQNVYLNNMWKGNTNKTNNRLEKKISLFKSLLKKILLNKYTPHFLHVFIFRIIRGKNITLK